LYGALRAGEQRQAIIDADDTKRLWSCWRSHLKLLHLQRSQDLLRLLGWLPAPLLLQPAGCLHLLLLLLLLFRGCLLQD
jgi:hypothetical protein